MVAARVLVVDGDQTHDVFELISISEGLARVRAELLFEVGEELTVRIEQAGKVSEVSARVRAHVGPADAPITELELSEHADPDAPDPTDPTDPDDVPTRHFERVG